MSNAQQKPFKQDDRNPQSQQPSDPTKQQNQQNQNRDQANRDHANDRGDMKNQAQGKNPGDDSRDRDRNRTGQ